MTPVDAILSRLLALHPKKIDLSLERMWRILDALGHPERRLPPVIHVGGTNGKGSTIAFMRAILEAADLRPHVYTSPHLVRFNERFRLAGPRDGEAQPPLAGAALVAGQRPLPNPPPQAGEGDERAAGGPTGERAEIGRGADPTAAPPPSPAPSVLVSDAELAEVLAECERVNANAPITVFEITTAAALVLFARHPADALLMEVGLGGRLDATNVVAQPLATVVTPVSVDHVDFLGASLEGIAAEKAGIFKRGVPAVLSHQPRAALAVLESAAARLSAPLHAAGEDWVAGEERGRLVYQDEDGLLDLPAPRLFGRHQFDNAGTAIAALRAAGFRLPASAYERGISRAEWPARLQRLSSGPLVSLIPAGAELWLDGGHNPEGGRAVAAALADLEERVSRPLVLVVGMLGTKDLHGFLRNFAGLARRVVAVPVQQDRALSPEAIAEEARGLGMPAEAANGIEAALAAIGRREDAPRILITGSLYLAGEALAANGTPPG
jgi:dihydrofolate synthase / folylpolyglutamate synthase